MPTPRYAYLDHNDNPVPCDRETWEEWTSENQDRRYFRTVSFSNNWTVYVAFSGYAPNSDGPPRFWYACAENPGEQGNYYRTFETLPETLEWFEHIVREVKGDAETVDAPAQTLLMQYQNSLPRERRERLDQIDNMKLLGRSVAETARELSVSISTVRDELMFRQLYLHCGYIAIREWVSDLARRTHLEAMDSIERMQGTGGNHEEHLAKAYLEMFECALEHWKSIQLPRVIIGYSGYDAWEAVVELREKRCQAARLLRFPGSRGRK